MRVFRDRVFRALQDPFSKSDLRLLAAAIRSMVYQDAEYHLLMFIDIIEFRNRHFADTFQKMPDQFRRLLGPVLSKVKKQEGWRGPDPAFALAAIYLYFFTYFVVERLMQGRQHLGVDDDQAIEWFIDFISHGFWEESPGSPSSAEKTSGETRRSQAATKARPSTRRNRGSRGLEK
jgi:hypothetical protein